MTDAAIATHRTFTCNPVSLIEADGCKWPIGDRDIKYCNNDFADNSPRTVYCTYHAKLAYQPRSIKVNTNKGYR
jgi:hypothetical protein